MRFFNILIVLLLTLGVGGCGPFKPSSLTQETFQLDDMKVATRTETRAPSSEGGSPPETITTFESSGQIIDDAFQKQQLGAKFSYPRGMFVYFPKKTASDCGFGSA
jgi:predicted metalloprotease